MAALEATIAHARRRGLLVILDAKRGDIGSTAEAYAAAYLAREPERAMACDAITVNLYLGMDSLKPFIDVCRRDGNGVFVLLRTSNPGSKDVQGLRTGAGTVTDAVADLVAPVAAATAGASGYGPIGAVVGATHPDEARTLRRSLPHSLFLVPGFGAQGGDVARVRDYCDPDGLGSLFSSSRAVLYPHLYGASAWSRSLVPAAAVDFVSAVRAAIA